MSNQANKDQDDQPGLFNSDDHAMKHKVTSTETVLYVLTNNLNLVDILSSGMIKSAAFYEKYYKDLGDVCPHAIPLLKVAPSAALVDAAIEKGEIIYPVILEISADGLSGPAWVISSKFTNRKGKVSQRENVTALLINGVLPSSIISGIHFRSEMELKEFTVRRYANLNPERENYRLAVSPHLFDGDISAADLLNAFDGACRKIPSLSNDVVTFIDAVEGMLSILGKYASLDREFPLRIYADVLNMYIGVIEPGSSLERSGSDYQWLVEFVESQGMPDLSGGPARLNTAKSDQHRSIQDLLGKLAVRQSIALKPEEFSPDSYLNTLLLTLEQHPMILASKPLLDEYKSAFDLLKEVRTGFTSPENLFERFPGGTHPILAGLYLHLLDNRPQNVNRFATEYRDLPVESRAFATCLTGALHGRTRLDLDCRSGSNLSYVLEMASILRINKAVESVHLVSPSQNAVVAANQTEYGPEELLLIGDETLIKRMPLQKKAAPLGTAEKRTGSLVSGGATSNEKDRKQEKGAAVMERIIDKLRNSDAFTPATHAGQLAVAICRVNRWFDLVSTAIPLREQEYYLENHRGKQEFRLSGYVVPEYRINRPDEFRSRLLSLTPDQMQQIKDSKLIGTIAAKLPEEWLS